MARGGLVALGVACLGTGSCIAYVHWEQKRDIRRMQQSILYDAEREALRRQVAKDRAKATEISQGKDG